MVGILFTYCNRARETPRATLFGQIGNAWCFCPWIWNTTTHRVIIDHNGIDLDAVSRNVGAQDVELVAVDAVRLDVFRSAL